MNPLEDIRQNLLDTADLLEAIANEPPNEDMTSLAERGAEILRSDAVTLYRLQQELGDHQ